MVMVIDESVLQQETSKAEVLWGRYREAEEAMKQTPEAKMAEAMKTKWHEQTRIVVAIELLLASEKSRHLSALDGVPQSETGSRGETAKESE